MALRSRWWWWWASVIAHTSVIAVVSTVAPGTAHSNNESEQQPEVGFDPVTAMPSVLGNTTSNRYTTQTREDSPALSAVRLGGPRSDQNLSASQPGERGDGRSEAPARRMAQRADSAELDSTLTNAREGTQEQRIHTAHDRRSLQDDRRTPNPADDPWVSTGDGVLLVRTARSRSLPAEGARREEHGANSVGEREIHRVNVLPNHQGEELLRETPSSGRAPLATGDLPPGQPSPSGLSGSHGRAHRVAGPVATQRPLVSRGTASTTADRAAVRPADDTDSALLASALLARHVNASLQDGPVRAQGVGGVGGGGDPGSGGGSARGGRANPYAQPSSGWLSLATDDPRYRRYFIRVRRALDALWRDAFPHDEALRGNFGTVIFGFVIERDGSVHGVELRRRSGIDRFDANVSRALRTARFPAIPEEITDAPLRIRAPFEFRNPVVR